MRVLAIVPLYPPRSRVGAWLATHEYLAHLVRRGHEVQVLVTLSPAPPYELDGVQVASLSRSKHRVVQGLPGVDLVVSHATGPGPAVELAQRLDVPHVRFLHGSHPQPDGLVGASLAACCAEASAAQVSGVPTLVCRPRLDPAAHLVESTGDAVTLVNLSERKGVRTFWRVAEAQPHRRYIGVRGGYGQQIEPRVPSVEVWPTQRNMRDVWAQTRVLVAPSEREAWGMVAAEAMVSGIPVIAHPTPGLVESLGDAAIFVDRDDTDGWCAALDRLDDPDEYAAASEAARARAAEIAAMTAADLDRFADTVEAMAAGHPWFGTFCGDVELGGYPDGRAAQREADQHNASGHGGCGQHHTARPTVIA